MDVVLIHGAYHGPWCWDAVTDALEAHGHSVVAPELPIDDPEAGTAAYARTVEEAISDLADPVLVAHSMAGTVAPLVAANRPVRQMIFVGAFLPSPGTSPQQQRELEPLDPPYEPTVVEFIDDGDGLWSIGEQTALEMFYHDVPSDLAARAFGRLRKQGYRWMTEITPLTAWPAVPSASIVCTDDRAINPAWVRSAARTRLGVTAAEIEGGHSPFLARPGELASLLENLAA